MTSLALAESELKYYFNTSTLMGSSVTPSCMMSLSTRLSLASIVMTLRSPQNIGMVTLLVNFSCFITGTRSPTLLLLNSSNILDKELVLAIFPLPTPGNIHLLSSPLALVNTLVMWKSSSSSL